MTITRLVRGVRNPNKVAIYVDSKYTFSVLDNILFRENLYVGKEINQKDIDYLKSIGERQELKNKVLNLIEKRPRSEWEVVNYLKNRTTPEETVELVEELKQDKYINDHDFAIWWIDQRQTFTNKSIGVIRQELLKKQINKEIIESELEKIDKETDLESAYELLIKKKKQIEYKNLEPKKLDQKLITYLQGKGFDWETVNQVINKLKEN